MKDDKFVILCVDDDLDVREGLRIFLEASDYVFVGAASAEEGLKTYKACAPDVVIVDLMMEEIDSGTKLVRELKAEGNTAPVFMLSAVGDSMHYNIDTTALGLAGVFQKPIDFKTLALNLKSKLKK